MFGVQSERLLGRVDVGSTAHGESNSFPGAYDILSRGERLVSVFLF